MKKTDDIYEAFARYTMVFCLGVVCSAVGFAWCENDWQKEILRQHQQAMNDLIEKDANNCLLAGK